MLDFLKQITPTGLIQPKPFHKYHTRDLDTNIFDKNQLFGELMQHNRKILTFHEKESFDRTEQILK